MFNWMFNIGSYWRKIGTVGSMEVAETILMH